jgi:hypothetical protein
VFIEKIIFQFNPNSYIAFVENYRNVFIVIAIGFVLHFIPLLLENGYKRLLVNTPMVLKVLYLFICLLIAIQFKQADAIKPIYLQF